MVLAVRLILFCEPTMMIIRKDTNSSGEIFYPLPTKVG
jgi:hypothetical protein